MNNIKENCEYKVFNIQRFSVHDGPGIRTTVFFKGCPLSCLWCANPECNLEYHTDKSYTAEQIVEIVLKDTEFYKTSGGGVTLSGGEPLACKNLLVLLKMLKATGLHICVETSGYVGSEAFAKALPYIDLLLFDFKHPSEQEHKRLAGVSNKQILKNAAVATERGNSIIARIPVIAGMNDSMEAAEGFAQEIKKLGIKELNLLPFHQFGEQKWQDLGLEYSMKDVPSTKDKELAELAKFFENKGFAVQIGG